MEAADETYLSSEPNFPFTCGIDGCPQTYKNYSSILSHISRKHPGTHKDSELNLAAAISSAIDDSTSSDVSSIALDDPITGSGFATVGVGEDARPRGNQSRLTRSAALFLITLKEKYALTQSAIDWGRLKK